MRFLRPLLSCLALAVLPIACTSGGSDTTTSGVAVAKYSGTWELKLIPRANSCSVSNIETETVTITLSGSTATIDTVSGSFTLQLVDGRLKGDNNGAAYDLGLISDDLLKGSVVNSAFCTFTYDVDGTRTGGGGATIDPSNYIGSWEFVVTPRANTCGIPTDPITDTVTIALNGTTATLTGDGETTLSLVNGRLVGTDGLSQYDIGLTSQNSIAGTLNSTSGGTCAFVADIAMTRL